MSLHQQHLLKYFAGTLVAVLTIIVGPTQADQSVNTDSTGLAISGYDPVAYFTTGEPRKGDFQITAEHDSATYRFANDANRQRFVSNPKRYIPQFGGYCAYGIAVGAKFSADPTVWKIVDDRLYLNLNQDIAQKFNADLEANISRANANWSDLAPRAVHDVNKDTTGLALRGYDPVAYFTQGQAVKGDFQMTAEHHGAVYRFASKEHRAMFMEEPSRYVPQFGGYCAYGVSVGAKFSADPTVWKIVDDKLYVNLDENIADKFNADLQGNIAKAKENWPNLAGSAAQ